MPEVGEALDRPGIRGHCNCGVQYWRVHHRKCNYSAFNGYHWTGSDYSGLHCVKCGHVWRSKSKYVDSTADGRLGGE